MSNNDEVVNFHNQESTQGYVIAYVTWDKYEYIDQQNVILASILWFNHDQET